MTSPLFTVHLPPGERLLLWVKEEDGTHGEVDLTDLLPELLRLGYGAPRLEAPEKDEPEKDEEEGPRGDFGHLEVSDDAVFYQDGEVMERDLALEYVAEGVVESLRAAVA